MRDGERERGGGERGVIERERKGERERELGLENFNTQGQKLWVHLDLSNSQSLLDYKTTKHDYTTNMYYKHE